MHAKSLQLCLTLCDPMGCNPPGSSVCGDSPGKNIGVGCHALLQGMLPTQLEPAAPALQADSFPLSPRGAQIVSINLAFVYNSLIYIFIYCLSVFETEYKVRAREV